MEIISTILSVLLLHPEYVIRCADSTNRHHCTHNPHYDANHAVLVTATTTTTLATTGRGGGGVSLEGGYRRGGTSTERKFSGVYSRHVRVSEGL